MINESVEQEKNIGSYGFEGRFKAEAAMYEDLFAGRILSQSKDLYRVAGEQGMLMAEVSGKLRYEAQSPADFPAVGDFVMMDRNSGETGNAIIRHLLTRKSVFLRKAAGTAGETQVVASNIDLLFICMSLNKDFNLRRLERYLSIGWDSGAIPVIVLTKADLCENVEEYVRQVREVAIGVEVLVTSSVEEDSARAVAKQMQPGQTVAFIGSSGVGKSTLINCLMGTEKMDTQGIRNDDKGRHTTTRRELILLESGAMVIDTPGMREIGVENADLAKAFVDIDALSDECRFSDCTHTQEPGCAIRAAIAQGSLTEERLSSYRKLRKEAKYDGMTSREIETTKINEMFAGVGGMKNARKFFKEKDKRRNR